MWNKRDLIQMQQYYLYIIKTYILYILVVKVVHQRPGGKVTCILGGREYKLVTLKKWQVLRNHIWMLDYTRAISATCYMWSIVIDVHQYVHGSLCA
jgi:hypothetical protein